MHLKPRQIYLAALIILAAVFSLYLWYNSSATSAFCLLDTGCIEVQNSEYGKIADISVSLLGAIAFVMLFIMYIISANNYFFYRWYFLAVIAGTIISLVLIAIQIFVLKQICSSCIVADILMLIITFLSAREFYKLRKYY